jgi:hypothetical protein
VRGSSRTRRCHRPKLACSVDAAWKGLTINGTTAPQPSAQEVFLRFAATTEERLKHLVANRKSDKPSPYARGTWTFSFALFGDFDQPSPAELLAKTLAVTANRASEGMST